MHAQQQPTLQVRGTRKAQVSDCAPSLSARRARSTGRAMHNPMNPVYPATVRVPCAAASAPRANSSPLCTASLMNMQAHLSRRGPLRLCNSQKRDTATTAPKASESPGGTSAHVVAGRRHVRRVPQQSTERKQRAASRTARQRCSNALRCPSSVARTRADAPPAQLAHAALPAFLTRGSLPLPGAGSHSCARVDTPFDCS